MQKTHDTRNCCKYMAVKHLPLSHVPPTAVAAVAAVAAVSCPPCNHFAGELCGLLLALQCKLGPLADAVRLPRPVGSHTHTWQQLLAAEMLISPSA
jgi:hypothetical protein